MSRKLRAGIIALVVCVVGSFLAYMLERCVQAEFNLQALVTVTRTLAQFVHREQRWPDSAEELESIEMLNGAFRWPSERLKVMSRVTIVYGAKLEDVADADAERFRYIIVHGPIYRHSANEKVRMLIEVSRRALNNRQRQGE